MTSKLIIGLAIVALVILAVIGLGVALVLSAEMTDAANRAAIADADAKTAAKMNGGTAPIPDELKFVGHGDAVKIVHLTAGTHIMTATAHATSKYGSGNFIVHVGEKLKINEIAQPDYAGQIALHVSSAGDYLIETNGGCDFTITIS